MYAASVLVGAQSSGQPYTTTPAGALLHKSSIPTSAGAIVREGRKDHGTPWAPHLTASLGLERGVRNQVRAAEAVVLGADTQGESG
jgi:hypothetical protein